MTESQEELTTVRRLLAAERLENAELKRENARLNLVLSGPHILFETAKSATTPVATGLEIRRTGMTDEGEHA